MIFCMPFAVLCWMPASFVHRLHVHFFFDSLTFQFSFFCTHTQNFAESMIPKQFYKRFELWTTVFLFDQLFRFCLFRINLFILFFEPHFLRTKYEIFNNSMGLREYVVNFNYVYLLLNSRWMFPGSSYLYKKTQLEKNDFFIAVVWLRHTMTNWPKIISLKAHMQEMYITLLLCN